MSALAVFTREGHDLRTFPVDGEPWFVAADVARMLGYSSTKDLTRRLDDDDKGGRSVPTPGGDQWMTTISEPGLYAAILGSQVEGAKAFKRWITHEVIPALRQTGTYALPTADPSTLTLADYAQHLVTLGQRAIESEAAREAAEARAVEATERVEQLEPAAAAWSDVVDADGTFDLAATAKLLGTGQVRLMARLRNDRVLTRVNLPRQEHIETGRMVVKVTPWHKPDGSAHVSRTTRVTAKGIDWLHARYGSTPAVVPLSLVGA